MRAWLLLVVKTVVLLWSWAATPLAAAKQHHLQHPQHHSVMHQLTSRPALPPPPLRQLTTRMRVCISAAHTKADLDFALEVFAGMVDM